MAKDKSLGQLYDVQIRIKILYTQSGWAYSFSTTVSVLSSKNMNHDKQILTTPEYFIGGQLLPNAGGQAEVRRVQVREDGQRVEVIQLFNFVDDSDAK